MAGFVKQVRAAAVVAAATGALCVPATALVAAAYGNHLRIAEQL